MKNSSIHDYLVYIENNRYDFPEKAIKKGKRAIDLYQSHESCEPALFARLCYLVGSSYCCYGKYPKALIYHERALDILNNYEDHELMADVYTSLASISKAQANYDSSLDFLRKALNLYRQSGKIKKTAFVQQRLANTLFELGHLEESKSQYLACEVLCLDKPGFSRLLVQVLVSIGVVFRELLDFSNAEVYSKKALDFCNSHPNHIAEANAKCEYGYLLFKKKHYDESIRYCEEAEIAFRDLNLIAYQCAAILYKAHNFSEKKSPYYNPEEAEKLYCYALALAGKSEFVEWIIQARKSLAHLYEQEEQFDKALDHLKEYYRLDQNRKKQASQKRIEHLQVTFEVENEKRKQEIEHAKNEVLQESNFKLRKLIDEKHEFMALAAHDLKNPLAGILGLIDHLKQSECKEEHEELSAILELMEQSSNNALHIVSNILEDNRLEEGRMDLEFKEVNLTPICHQIAKRYCDRAKTKGIIIRCDCGDDYSFKIDEFSFRQILDNLISNAVKFCRKGDEVVLDLNLLESGDVLELLISDTGPGIPSADMPNLFRRFSKLSNKPTANEGSSGLGLSIVKKLVELNGGNIRCQSKVGAGTTFIARFER